MAEMFVVSRQGVVIGHELLKRLGLPYTGHHANGPCREDKPC